MLLNVLNRERNTVACDGAQENRSWRVIIAFIVSQDGYLSGIAD